MKTWQVRPFVDRRTIPTLVLAILIASFAEPVRSAPDVTYRVLALSSANDDLGPTDLTDPGSGAVFDQRLNPDGTLASSFLAGNAGNGVRHDVRPAIDPSGAVVFNATTDAGPGAGSEPMFVWDDAGQLNLLAFHQLGPGIFARPELQPLPVAGSAAAVDTVTGSVYQPSSQGVPRLERVLFLDSDNRPLESTGDTRDNILPWPGGFVKDFVFNRQGFTLLRFLFEEHKGTICDFLGCRPDIESKEDICFVSPDGTRTIVALAPADPDDPNLPGPFAFLEGLGHPAINSATPPQGVYRAQVRDVAVAADVEALYLAAFTAPGEGASTLIAAEGRDAGTAPDGQALTFDIDPVTDFFDGLPVFNDPSINDQGEVAFSARILDETGTTRDGLWRYDAALGALELLAISGTAAGATARQWDAATAVGFLDPTFDAVAIAGNGHIAFRGRSDGDGGGLWRWNGSSIDPVALVGDAAPGLAPGFVFDGFSNPTANAGAHFAFLAAARSGSDTLLGIWAEDAAGELRLVIAEGEGIEVAPGDVRTVVSFFDAFPGHFEYPQGGQDGHPNPWNDDHQLVVVARDDAGEDLLIRADVLLACETGCTADFNGDQRVDGADLGLLLAAWGTADPCSDLNDDGIVDGADLAVLLGLWTGEGTCTP